MAYFGLFFKKSARMGRNENKMISPSYFVKVAAVSHGNR